MKQIKPLAGFLAACALSVLPLTAHAETIVLDPAYGTGGKVVDSGSNASKDSVLVSGGKLVATSFWPFGCSRYLSTGALDTTFGTSGRASASFGTQATGQTHCVAVQADGKIIVGGTVGTNGSTLQNAIARFTASGALDTTFSGDGKALLDSGTIYDIALQSDGKIVACGVLNDLNARGFIYRFNSDGTLDTTFSGDGKLVKDYGSQSNGTGYNSLWIQSDGKIVVTGAWYNDFVTTRFNSDGTIDTTFGTTGTVTTDLSNSSSFDYPSKVVVLGDGKVAVIGTTTLTSTSQQGIIGMVRYTSTGALDTVFNNGGTPGIVLQAFTGSTEGVTVGLIGGGKFLVGGTNNGNFIFVRFFSNGTLDTSLNGTGFVTADFGTSSDRSYGMVFQSGSVTLSGESNNSLALARFVVEATPTATAATPSGSSS